MRRKQVLAAVPSAYRVFNLICFCYGLIIYVPSYRVSSLESMDVCIYVHLD